jgi:hypothetical protein
MGTLKALRRAASLLASASLVVVVSCLGPTEVTLVLTTDVPCSAQRGTSIAVGDSGDIAASAPVTVTGDCALAADGGMQDGGTLAVPAEIGTLVVVPSGSRSASFTVQIVTAVDPVGQPGDCAALGYQGCIVARRQLSFIPHTPLTLPIEMTLDCVNVSCTAEQTCYHAHCVTADTVCMGSACALAVPSPDASSSGDDVTTQQAGPDATSDMSDAPAVDDASAMDGPSVVGSEESSTMDAPAIDGPPDVGLQDAPSEDAPQESAQDAAPEASIHDAAGDVAAGESDASDASPPPSDGGIPGDGSPLGTCVVAGSSSGVECAGGRCTAGDVCCVTFYPGGGTTTEACAALSACDYNSTSGSTIYSALACRNVGDCPSGKVCCDSASTAGSGNIAQCATSCPYIAVKQATACTNNCECGSSTPQCNAASCLGYTIGLCGSTLGSSCF